MEGLFPCRAFTGFGPNRLEPDAAPAPLHRVRARRASGLRTRVGRECPRQPGVYGMINAHGELIYVGKAKCLRARLLGYFRARSRDPKAARIVVQARVLVREPAASEFAALLRELELIRHWRPRFNILGQPQRRQRSYVCLGRRPAPYVFLAPRPTSRVLACYGPIPAGRRAREAVRRLNDWFRLRDCPQAQQQMVFAEQQELFPVLRAAGCLRHEIGTCLGPCAAACSQADYATRVREARAFLEGADTSPLELLERDMTAAAAELAFERAADLRDKLDILRWLRNQLDRLRLARDRHSFIYPVAGHEGRCLWYLIHRGLVRAATAAPTEAVAARAAAAAIETAFQEKHTARAVPAADEIDGVLLVAAWFRRHPQELARTLEPARALRMCR